MELQNTSGMSLQASSRRRATGCSHAAQADPNLNQVRLSELPDVASLKVDVNQQRIAAARPQHQRRQQYALDRLGRPLCQRFHRSRPGQARLRPGRRALSRGAVATSTNGPSATTRARWCPSRPSRRRAGRPRRDQLCRASRASILRIPGPAGAGQELGRGDGPDRAARRRKSPASASPGPGSPIRNGCRPARRRCSTASR